MPRGYGCDESHPQRRSTLRVGSCNLKYKSEDRARGLGHTPKSAGRRTADDCIPCVVREFPLPPTEGHAHDFVVNCNHLLVGFWPTTYPFEEKRRIYRSPFTSLVPPPEIGFTLL